MKILVASPTYDGMEYCLNDFITAIKKIDYPDFEILLVDNSRNKNFFNRISQDKQIKVIYDETPEEKNLLRLVSSSNLILDYAKENNFDYVLMMDSDVIPPKNILKELISQKKDIVSGLYYNLFPYKETYCWFPIAWRKLTDEEYSASQKVESQFSGINKEDLRKHITEKEVRDGNLMEVLVASNGCVLLSRKVFENKNLRYGLSEEVPSAQDVFFFRKCREAGIKIFCYPKILCDHLLQGKFNILKNGSLQHPIYQ